MWSLESKLLIQPQKHLRRVKTLKFKLMLLKLSLNICLRARSATAGIDADANLSLENNRGSVFIVLNILSLLS